MDLRIVRKLLVGRKVNEFFVYFAASLLITGVILWSTSIGLRVIFVANIYKILPEQLESSLIGFVPILTLLFLSTYLAYTEHGWLTCFVVTGLGLHVLFRAPYGYSSDIGSLSIGMIGHVLGILLEGIPLATATFVVGAGLRSLVISFQGPRRINNPGN